MPGRSSRGGVVGAGRLSSSTPPTTATAAKSRFTYMVERQLRCSVRNPPSSSPTAPPDAASDPNTPKALPRSAGAENVVVSSESAAGASSAANTPCRERAVTRIPKVAAAPPTAEAAAKPICPMRKARRRPNLSASRPPSSSRLPKVIAYEVTTHCRWSSENPRSAWAEGRAMFTMVASRTTMSWARPMTARIHHRRGSGCAAVVGTAGVVLVPGRVGSADMVVLHGFRSFSLARMRARVRVRGLSGSTMREPAPSPARHATMPSGWTSGAFVSATRSPCPPFLRRPPSSCGGRRPGVRRGVPVGPCPRCGRAGRPRSGDAGTV